jgi:hypothetical protein
MVAHLFVCLFVCFFNLKKFIGFFLLVFPFFWWLLEFFITSIDCLLGIYYQGFYMAFKALKHRTLFYPSQSFLV